MAPFSFHCLTFATYALAQQAKATGEANVWRLKIRTTVDFLQIKIIKCKSKNKNRAVYPCLTKSVKLTLISAQLTPFVRTVPKSKKTKTKTKTKNKKKGFKNFYSPAALSSTATLLWLLRCHSEGLIETKNILTKELLIYKI